MLPPRRSSSLGRVTVHSLLSHSLVKHGLQRIPPLRETSSTNIIPPTKIHLFEEDMKLRRDFFGATRESYSSASCLSPPWTALSTIHALAPPETVTWKRADRSVWGGTGNPGLQAIRTVGITQTNPLKTRRNYLLGNPPLSRALGRGRNSYLFLL